MKKFYSRFRIALITFALGLSSVFMINGSLSFSREVPVTLPQVETTAVFEIITKENWKGFQFVGQGCGGRNKYNGEIWVSGYRTNDWKSVSVSGSSHETTKETINEFNLRIKDASRILEIAEKRAVIENQEGENKSVNIIFFEDRRSLRIIDASKLETAIEFELWLKSHH